MQFLKVPSKLATLCVAGLAAATVSFAAPAMAAGKGAELVPVKTFASLPNYQRAKLSPDGKQIGYLTHWKGRTVLVLENLDGTDQVVVPSAEDASIFTFHWATDNRILVVYEFSMQRPGSRVVSSQTRLAAVDRDGGNMDWIVKGELFAKVGSRTAKERKPVAQFQHDILDLLPDDPEHILLALDADWDGDYEVWRLNIFNSNYKVVRDDTRGVQDWYMDHTGTIRLGIGYSGSERVAILLDGAGNWVSLRKTDWYESASIAGFSVDPNVIYVRAPNKFGTQGLYKLALDSGTIIETVFENEKVDIGGVLKDPETDQPVGYYYTDDLYHAVYFDPTLDKIQQIVDKSLKGTSNGVIGKAKGRHAYLVLADSDRDPGVYYYLDLDAKSMNVLAPYMAGIDPANQAPVQPVSIPVRDGSHIPGYLTLPLGHDSAVGLPAVVLPHGGPLGVRDTAGWDWWAQFLANRGYAVLQPNFRGSGGYGAAFRMAGENQWGGLMQDDVTDATRWLIANGGVDAGRICIVGGSYGGYAALMGVVKEPDLYKCAVSVNGVADIPDLKDRAKNFVGGYAWIKTMGLAGASDSDVSPARRADEIKVPVLLVAAKDDATVDYHQSEDMAKKLRKLKKKGEFVLLDDGGHSMDTAESRAAMLTALEKFLKEQLGK
ncbi:MAG: S9 family peptidase [Alphaproteobacteria bacterium]|nr:MAG: S9 family peptidase [Alphaproteobacteria bacterium]